MAAPAAAQSIDPAQFGARANDGGGDSAGIQRALAAASRSGGTVVLGRGTYLIDRTISVPSNVSIAGAGCGRTVLRRSGAGTGQIMFRLEGTRRASFRGLSFDYQGAPEFFRAIGFRGAGSSDIDIIGNCFNETRPSTSRGDRWGIELSASGVSRNIRILDNKVERGLQLTAGGGRGLQNVTIRGNDIRGAKANGIALSTTSNGASFDNIVIENNAIYDALSIGIYLGPDKPSVRSGRFSNVRIANNTISGLRRKFAYGVFVRAAAGGFSGLKVQGNTIDGRGSGETIAIRLLDDHGKATREFRGVDICGNTGRNISRGVWLQAVNGANIGRNSMSGSRPFTADEKTNRGIRQGGC